MRKIGMLFAVAVLLLGVAFAAPYTFEDDAFDYTDSDITTGYVALRVHDDGELVIVLTSVNDLSVVATIDVDGEVGEHSSDFGYYEATHDIAGRLFTAVEMDYRGEEFYLVRFRHEDQSAHTVKDSYLARLAELDLTVEHVSTAGSTDVYTVTTSTGSFQLGFAREGHDTLVTFSF